MPGNPLTDPNWAPELADTVERVVGTVREKTTDNVVKAARIIVFGLLAAFLGITALILLVITFTRALQVLLDFAVHTRSSRLHQLLHRRRNLVPRSERC